ncbi:MAG TPA: MFS transporter [Xanthobacteraceae bacterium]|nr:MFS transporter [Xanthobacteraceae bacterium]
MNPTTVPRTGASTIETSQSWVIATVALACLAFSFGGFWIVAVGLKAIAADAGGQRSVPALAGALAWLGSAFGGLAMGPLATRFGIRWTAIFGAAMIAVGLCVSTLGPGLPLYIGHGLFMGLIGNAGLNAPLYIYVSRWFDRRRGSALALISSGSYIAGAVWPTIFERAIAVYGWQHAMQAYAAIEIAVIVPLAAIFFRPPPESVTAPAGGGGPHKAVVRGIRPNTMFAMMAAAAFMCCVPMAMPQGHIVAFCSDLGIAPTVGAAMLSVILGTAFVTRQLWGVLSDRIGGLLTVLLGSAVQATAMVAFLLTQDEIGLFTVSAVYGLGFAGIIPAYVLAIREFFPARDASWRIPIVLLFSGSGMAAGGWVAGVLYDHFGYYLPAFATGIAFNLVNLALVGTLVFRQQREGGIALDAGLVMGTATGEKG